MCSVYVTFYVDLDTKFNKTVGCDGHKVQLRAQ